MWSRNPWIAAIQNPEESIATDSAKDYGFDPKVKANEIDQIVFKTHGDIE
jgi:hypothetical protein